MIWHVTTTAIGRKIHGLAAAIAFYTCLPIPTAWALEFRDVAQWVPLIGVLIGGVLGGVDSVLHWVGVPVLTRSAILVIAWIGITGGLHLDGAMDSADGLAVQDPQRRLQVMSDSATGAFGAMAAVAVVLLKTLALTDLADSRGLMLILAAGWGRWSQQLAIARYPYLKPTGKGAFHKQSIRSFWQVVPGWLLLLGLCSLLALLMPQRGWGSLVAGVGGSAIAFLVPDWFNRQLGGHTGDTYGASVEWTEALFLVLMTVLH